MLKTRIAPTDAVAYEPPRLPTGPILAASDAAPESDAALSMAQLLAARTSAAVQVISVLPPFSSGMYAYDLVPVPLEDDATARKHRELDVRGQVARTQIVRAPQGASAWPVIVETGDPASILAERAREVGARVVVTGRGRHHLLGRVLGGEMLLKLLQAGDTPVFAVDSTLTHLPRRVLIGIDFSEQSLYAAHVALAFVAPDALVSLVHVAPHAREWDSAVRKASDSYQRQVRSALTQLRDTLQRGELRFEEVLLTGKPADALLAYARDVDADLIASATHGYGFIRRAMLGSVASSLVRGAACSLLCVPGSAHTASAAYARRLAAGEAFAVHPDQFDQELGAFSRRNARRLCAVERHDDHLGAQPMGRTLPLVGATYDKHTASATLMFGASELRGAHLSHVVADVRAIEIARDLFGRDVSLRLIHDDAATLVELE